MKMRWAWIFVAMLVAVPMMGLRAMGHGDKVHVIGVIEKVDANSITVKTKEGKSVEVKLAPATIYTDNTDKPAKLADLAVGQRVVIHADPKGTDLIAATVKYAAAGAVAAPK
jgi:hypothetical protein